MNTYYTGPGSFGYPQSYSYPQPQVTTFQPQTMIWVNGEKEASGYPCAPGASVTLWDSELPRFYIKSVDNSGMPMPLRRFKYVEDKLSNDTEVKDSDSKPKYLTMDDLKEVLKTYVTKEEIGGA